MSSVSQDQLNMLSIMQTLFKGDVTELTTLMNTPPDKCKMMLNGKKVDPESLLLEMEVGTSEALTGLWEWETEGNLRLEGTCLPRESSGIYQKTGRLWFVAQRRLVSVVYEDMKQTLADGLTHVRFSAQPDVPFSLVVMAPAGMKPA